MDSSGDTIVNARPLMIYHNFHLCSISKRRSTKNPGVILVFNSTTGLRIEMDINIQHPSSLRLDRLLSGRFSLVEMIQNPPERPGTVALCFTSDDISGEVQRVRYLPIDTDVSFFCALPNGKGVFVNNFSPTTVLEVFMLKWNEGYWDYVYEKQRNMEKWQKYTQNL